MAIICRDYKLLFIMVPGTGCSSIGTVLQSKLGGEFIPNNHIIMGDNKILGKKHNTINQLIEHKLISKKALNSYVKFATVRNPFDLLVTRYQRLVGTWMEVQMQSPLLDDWADPHYVSYVQKLVKHNLNRVKEARQLDFENWLKKELNSWKENIIDGQALTLSASGYLDFQGIDYIIRYETLENDFNNILKKVGIQDWIDLPHINPTRGKKNYRIYYTNRLKMIVEKRLANELSKFNYSF